MYTYVPPAEHELFAYRQHTKNMNIPGVICSGVSDDIWTVTNFKEHLKVGGGNYLFRALPDS